MCATPVPFACRPRSAIARCQLDPVTRAGTIAVGGLVLENVQFAYNSRPDKQVLRGVDIAVDAGSVCALVGRSGSGAAHARSPSAPNRSLKGRARTHRRQIHHHPSAECVPPARKPAGVAWLITSTTYVTVRYYDVTGGRILVDGRDIRDLELRSLHSVVGLVAQDTQLFGGTIEENIAYGVPKYERGDEMRRKCLCSWHPLRLAHATSFGAAEELYEAARQANCHDFIMGKARAPAPAIRASPLHSPMRTSRLRGWLPDARWRAWPPPERRAEAARGHCPNAPAQVSHSRSAVLARLWRNGAPRVQAALAVPGRGHQRTGL